jgi:hypothetical protein
MVIQTILLSKFFHDAIYFLALSRKSEARKHSLQRLNIRHISEVERVDIRIKYFFVEINILPEIFADFGLIQRRCSF